jgi:hypothetical protein
MLLIGHFFDLVGVILYTTVKVSLPKPTITFVYCDQIHIPYSFGIWIVLYSIDTVLRSVLSAVKWVELMVCS